MLYRLYEACKNRFIILNVNDGHTWEEDQNFRNILSKLGKDQRIDSILILTGNPWRFDKQGYHCTMDVYEPRSDSISTMCGNGIRAVCSYWIDQGYDLSYQTELLIKTKSGVRRVMALGSSIFQADMGTLSFNSRDLGDYVVTDKLSHNKGQLEGISLCKQLLKASLKGIQIKNTIIGLTGDFLDGRVNGEPHLVFFLKQRLSLELLKSLTSKLGKTFTTYKDIFPKEINTSVVSENSKNIFICTYERGVYYVTNSCGTANAVTGGYLLAVSDKKRIKINNLGGELWVERDLDNRINLIGHATRFK